MRSIMLVPLVARGRVLGALACARAESGRGYEPSDLTLAEELARRAALAVDNALLYREAQRAVRVRDDFLASASHELRTPLGHIKGFASTLRQSDVDWDEGTRRDFLGEIERESDRLSEMITNLLDMSRIESGGLDPVERSPAPLGTLVSRGVARVRGLLDGRPVLVRPGGSVAAGPCR
jgi:K+-sensing histidine kinase KdpD